jgi:hypothetical protein
MGVRGMTEKPATQPLRPARPLESGLDANRLFEASFDGSTLLLLEDDLGPAFFDLRTGLAGELLQKFVNFRIPLAIVVPSPQKYGDRFKELAHEHRSHPVVRFFATEDEARAWLKAKGASA